MTTSAQRPPGGWEQPDLGLTWSPEDSPASPSARPDAAEALRTSAGAGPGSPTWCAWYDPPTSSWRTSQLSFEMLTPSGGSSPTWPRAGMTRTGTAFRLRPSAPRTSVTGSSWLPTPSATPYGSNQSPSPGAAIRPSLDSMARSGLWPTPKAADGERGGRGDLLAMVRTGRDSRRRRWPTPTTQDAENDGGPSQLRRKTLPLNAAVKVWPTPTASRRSGLQSHGRTAIPGQLNPTWVEWLMGFPLGWTDLKGSETP